MAEAAAVVLLVEQDTDVEVHIADCCGNPSHGASEGDDVAWSRRVAACAVRWHVLEDSSIDEGRSFCSMDVMGDITQDAFAHTRNHTMSAEVEALPPRRR
jgi:hypothetical protein